MGTHTRPEPLERVRRAPAADPATHRADTETPAVASYSPHPGALESAAEPTALLSAVQRKVVVGSAEDPAEAEADRAAELVLAYLQRKPVASGGACCGSAGETGHVHRHADRTVAVQRSGGGCSCGAGDGHIHRHGGGDHDHGHDHGHEAATPTVGWHGGDLDGGSEQLLRSASAAGLALPGGLRDRLEPAFGADLSGVRLHTGSVARSLNVSMGASAFTHGNDIFFRDGMPDTSAPAGVRLLAHELAHTVQQGSSPLLSQTQRAMHEHEGPAFADATGVLQRSADRPIVQRHAAYEHYLLGQVSPAELAKIPKIRQVKDNKEQKGHVKEGKFGGLKPDQGDDQDKADVKHTLEQEMARLIKYRDKPDLLNAQLDEKGQTKKKEDGTYGVPIVVLTCKGGDKVVVSYSEMNTMPDLFGNPEAIEATPKAQVLALLQGIRQQLYIELANLKREIFGDDKSVNELHHKARLDEDFRGAQGPRSQAVNDKIYEIRTEKQVNKATTRPGEKQEQYFAALERNACHFAPESWEQWRGYHDKAVALAAKAGANKLAANGRRGQPDYEDFVARYDALAAEFGNQAMILNSFGEHYLQDSFASGHLIDKTKIMQWFTLWLGEHGGIGSTSKAKAQFAMMMYAAKSDLQSNPQALHDKGVRGELTSAKDASAEIGMGSDESIMLMLKWRSAAKSNSKSRTITVNKAAELFGTEVNKTERDLLGLVDKGFATRKDKGLLGRAVDKIRGRGTGDVDRAKTEFTLDKNHVDAVGERMGPAGTGPAYKSDLGEAGQAQGKHNWDAEMAEFNVASYNLMLSNAYIGGATKYFHDMFCKEGLEVQAGTTGATWRIYGDSNMLNAGAQEGVAYAAETSQLSREAIFQLIDGADIATVTKTQDIYDRFPKHVMVKGKPVPLKSWNESLRNTGEKDLFKEARNFGAKFISKTPGLTTWETGGISDEGALAVKKLTADLEAQPF